MTVLAAAPGWRLMTTLELLGFVSKSLSRGALRLTRRRPRVLDSRAWRAFRQRRNGYERKRLQQRGDLLPDAHSDRAIYKQRPPSRVIDKEKGGYREQDEQRILDSRRYQINIARQTGK